MACFNPKGLVSMLTQHTWFVYFLTQLAGIVTLFIQQPKIKQLMLINLIFKTYFI